MNSLLRTAVLFWWNSKELLAVLLATFVGVVGAVMWLTPPLLYYALVLIGWFGGQWAFFASPKYNVETNY